MPETDDLRLPRPPALAAERISPAAAAALLARWHHPSPERWLAAKAREGRVVESGDPEGLDAADLWRELLADECDKLLNQAWCALEQIRAAEGGPPPLMLAMDDLPTAVEQAYSLAPPLAREHLELLGGYREEMLAQLLGELRAGTGEEARARAECLEFWEENAEGISDLRRTLFGLVRATLERPEGGAPAPLSS